MVGLQFDLNNFLTLSHQTRQSSVLNPKKKNRCSVFASRSMCAFFRRACLHSTAACGDRLPAQVVGRFNYLEHTC